MANLVGILCEKPSQARNFAKALGGMSGNYNGEDYVIVPARGHLYRFKDPSLQVPANLKDRYAKWSLGNLPWDERHFSWDKEPLPDTSTERNNIKKVLGPCDELVIGTDVDPSGEGQLLAWEVLSDLKFTPKKWTRMYFDDEAPASIQKAFKNRKQIPYMDNDPEYKKAHYRERWDMLSMQWTRIASCITGVKLREGRLKSYMAYATGLQEDAVKNYKKIPYYQWRFKDENGNVFSDPNEPNCPTKEEMVQKYTDSKVIVDSTEKKSTPPPKLIDLATLSASLTSKGIKAKEVLDTYQKMYEDQVVSYPRTEDKFITPEQFNDLLPLVDKIAGVVGVDPSILTHRTPRSTHVKVGAAHGANRPGINVPANLASLAKYGKGAAEIYEVLARNYLAMLCEDYYYTNQKGHLEKYPTFKGSANQMISIGFKAIYTDPSDDEDDTNGKLLGAVGIPFIYEGFPPKPQAPTVKWLMKQLEKNDIGTGATRTSTFAEVSNGSKDALIKETKGKISLTDVGRMSYLILPGTHIGSMEITADVFNEMKLIEKGQLNAEECLMKVQQMIVDDIEVMKNNLANVKREFPTAGRLPEDKPTAGGTYAPTGTQVTFNKVWAGHTFTDEEVMHLLAGEEISFDVEGNNGAYTVSGKLEEQTYKGHKFWGFAKKQSDCPPDKVEGLYKPKKTVIRFKRVWSGHTFTDAEIASLLNGDTITFAATSSSGNQYQATGKLQLQTYNGAKFWGFKPDFGKK